MKKNIHLVYIFIYTPCLDDKGVFKRRIYRKYPFMSLRLAVVMYVQYYKHKTCLSSINLVPLLPFAHSPRMPRDTITQNVSVLVRFMIHTYNNKQ